MKPFPCGTPATARQPEEWPGDRPVWRDDSCDDCFCVCHMARAAAEDCGCTRCREDRTGSHYR